MSKKLSAKLLLTSFILNIICVLAVMFLFYKTYSNQDKYNTLWHEQGIIDYSLIPPTIQNGSDDTNPPSFKQNSL
jgi:hypothetical protein